MRLKFKSWISVIWLYVSCPRVLSFSRIYPDYFPPPQITEHGQIRNLEIGARQYWGGVVCKTPCRAFHFSIRNFRKTTYAHGTHMTSRSVVYLQKSNDTVTNSCTNLFCIYWCGINSLVELNITWPTWFVFINLYFYSINKLMSRQFIQNKFV